MLIKRSTAYTFFRDLLSRHQRLSHSEGIAAGDGISGQSTQLESRVSENQLGFENLDNSAGPIGQSLLEPHYESGTASSGVVLHNDPANESLMLQDLSWVPQPLNEDYVLPDMMLDYGNISRNQFQWDNFLTADQPAPYDFFGMEMPAAYQTLAASQHVEPPLPINEGSSHSNHHSFPASTSAPEQRQSHNRELRLPSLEPAIQPPEENSITLSLVASSARRPKPFVVVKTPWKISAEDYLQITEKIGAAKSGLLQPVRIPSRHTLSRYLEGYFRGFHDHFPFIHMPTFSAASLAPELMLSLAAMGAFYRFEHSQGQQLYYAAKGVIDHRLDTMRVAEATAAEFTTDQSGLPVLQGLVILLALSSWGSDRLARDSISLSGQIALLARDLGISSSYHNSADDTWDSWILIEECRRTFWSAYCLLTLQNVSNNMTQMILNTEISMDLPSCNCEWRAQNATEWADFRNQETLSFRDVLHDLSSGIPVHQKKLISSFGNYVLIVGIFQQIYLARLAASQMSKPESPLSPDFIQKIESTLLLWQQSWEATYESTLDPSSPKGPMGFNSTALLRLAYIRLNSNLSPASHFIRQDPSRASDKIKDTLNKPMHRSSHTDRAVLQCIYALSVPVRVGVAFVARTQTLHWSAQHAICTLECAFFLAQWLRSLGADTAIPGQSELVYPSALRTDEQRLLDILISLIRETDLADSIETSGQHQVDKGNLIMAVAQLWGGTIEGLQVFEIVQKVGEHLQALASKLQT